MKSDHLVSFLLKCKSDRASTFSHGLIMVMAIALFLSMTGEAILLLAIPKGVSGSFKYIPDRIGETKDFDYGVKENDVARF